MRASAKSLLEVEDVAQVGAAPLVDRLIRVADDREVAMASASRRIEHVLRPVRVLVLVDHDVLELARVERSRTCSEVSKSSTVFSSRSSKSSALLSLSAARYFS